MQVTLQPMTLAGAVPAIASKSFAHRLLMAAALADRPTVVRCTTRSEDILATVRVLRALGARIEDTGDAFAVTPLRVAGGVRGATLDCGESGTTERFMLPILAALGLDGAITGHGRLPERPLSPLYDVLVAHGMTLSPQGTFPLTVRGRLPAGDYRMAGNVSSQFVGGLLYALALCPGTSTLTLTDTIESVPYIRMTLDVLSLFGAHIEAADDLRTYRITGRETLVTPGTVTVEADWSNAAFWLVAGALTGDAGLTLTGITTESRQGDRRVVAILKAFGADVTEDREAATLTVRPCVLRGQTIDAAHIPDLVPVLSVVAAAAEGETTFVNAGRLRIKESDRLETTAALLRALGVTVHVGPDTLTVVGRGHHGERGTFSGGTVEGANDHRIVMSAAVAALRAEGAVTIRGADAVRKSYPSFFEDAVMLGARLTTEDVR